jgi:hypothetical protein
MVGRGAWASSLEMFLGDGEAVPPERSRRDVVATHRQGGTCALEPLGSMVAPEPIAKLSWLYRHHS